MRARRTHQLNLFSVTVRHDIGKELEVISSILDENQDILDFIFNDLASSRRKDTGRNGLNAEQVLRICVLKQFRSLSYEELAFHLEDCTSFTGEVCHKIEKELENWSILACWGATLACHVKTR
ncbi:MAG: hypothetical protein JXR80_08475 [Deltaproteobacteria bacterium]|nr:hypothetical protein [Deltaproteobacteria bacterium]